MEAHPAEIRIATASRSGRGLSDYRARYYSPTLQRFISEDPSGELAGPNEYGYAGQSPSNFADPSGEILVVSGDKEAVQEAIDYLEDSLASTRL